MHKANFDGSKLTYKSPHHYSNVVDDFYTVCNCNDQTRLHFSFTQQRILKGQKKTHADTVLGFLMTGI